MENGILKNTKKEKVKKFFSKTWKYILSFIVSIVIITLIFIYQVDFNLLKTTFNEANILFILLAALFYIIGLVIGAIKLQYLLYINGFKINFFKTLLYHTYGMLFSSFTPAKSGYTLIAYPLKVNDFPVTKTFSIFFIGQLYDFALRIPVTIIGIIFLFIDTNSTNYVWLGVIGLSILVVLSLGSYVFASGKLFNIEKIFSKRLKKIGNFIRKYKEQFKKISLKQSIFLTIITSLGWIAFAFKWYFISFSINYRISFIDSAFLLPLIFVISFLPISLAGLGFVESGIIFLYIIRYPSLDRDLVVSIGLTFMIIERIINLVTTVPGLLTYIELPRIKKLKEKERDVLESKTEKVESVEPLEEKPVENKITVSIDTNEEVIDHNEE